MAKETRLAFLAGKSLEEPEKSGRKRLSNKWNSVKELLKKKALLVSMAIFTPIAAAEGYGTVSYHSQFESSWPEAIAHGLEQDFYLIVDFLQDRDSTAKLDKPTPATFDNDLPSTVAKVGINAAPISEEQWLDFQNNDTNPVQENATSLPEVTMLFQAKLLKNDKIAVITDRIEQGYDPFSKEIGPMDTGKTIIFARSGTEIGLPRILGVQTDECQIFRKKLYDAHGKSWFNGIIIRFVDQDGNIWVEHITAPKDVRDLALTEDFEDIPILTNAQDERNLAVKGKVVSFEEDVSVVETSASNASVKFALRVYTPGSSKFGFAQFVFAVDDSNKLAYR